jgi:hypothetical protein
MLRHTHYRFPPNSMITPVAIVRILVALICLLTPPSAFAEPLTRLALHEKVYLIRGFTNVLSPGIDQLAAGLRKRNVSTVVANHAFYPALAKEALQDCKSGRVSSIVLVGHSFGASAAIAIAETLQKSGVQVALIVTFDPVLKTSVPANVHQVENFYVSMVSGAQSSWASTSAGI